MTPRYGPPVLDLGAPSRRAPTPGKFSAHERMPPSVSLTNSRPAPGVALTSTSPRARPSTLAAGDQRALDAVPLERGQSFVSRVAFGDAAEVEQHPWLQELGGALFGVEAQFLVAYEFERLGQTVRVGQLVPAARPPPQSHHRADRDVERSA